MSAQANIVAFDGASTPVSHTLVAASVGKDPKTGDVVAVWREGITTIPSYAQVVCESRARRLPSGVWRVQLSVSVPVMESISGQNAAGYTAAPKVAYTNRIDVVGYFHERSTIAERRLCRQLAINIANGIATTVTPVTTGPTPELIDQLVSPS